MEVEAQPEPFDRKQSSAHLEASIGKRWAVVWLQPTVGAQGTQVQGQQVL